jgi:hypothetical protein
VNRIKKTMQWLIKLCKTSDGRKYTRNEQYIQTNGGENLYKEAHKHPHSLQGNIKSVCWSAGASDRFSCTVGPQYPLSSQSVISHVIHYLTASFPHPLSWCHLSHESCMSLPSNSLPGTVLTSLQDVTTKKGVVQKPIAVLHLVL